MADVDDGLVEAVAKAIYAHDVPYGWDKVMWGDLKPLAQRRFRTTARAAIAAVLEWQGKQHQPNIDAGDVIGLVVGP